MSTFSQPAVDGTMERWTKTDGPVEKSSGLLMMKSFLWGTEHLSSRKQTNQVWQASTNAHFSRCCVRKLNLIDEDLCSSLRICDHVTVSFFSNKAYLVVAAWWSDGWPRHSRYVRSKLFIISLALIVGGIFFHSSDGDCFTFQPMWKTPQQDDKISRWRSARGFQAVSGCFVTTFSCDLF